MTNQATTAPGNRRHGATQPDTRNPLNYGNQRRAGRARSTPARTPARSSSEGIAGNENAGHDTAEQPEQERSDHGYSSHRKAGPPVYVRIRPRGRPQLDRPLAVLCVRAAGAIARWPEREPGSPPYTRPGVRPAPCVRQSGTTDRLSSRLSNANYLGYPGGDTSSPAASVWLTLRCLCVPGIIEDCRWRPR